MLPFLLQKKKQMGLKNITNIRNILFSNHILIRPSFLLLNFKSERKYPILIKLG